MRLQQPLVHAFLSLGLLFTSFQARAETFRPWLSPAEVKSLQKRLQQSLPDTNRVNVLLCLAEDFCHRGNRLDSADRYCQKALSLSKAIGFTKGQICSVYISGVVAAMKGDSQRAIALITKAINRSHLDTALQAEGWFYLGSVYDRSPEGLTKRIEHWKQSRQLYHQLKNTEKEAYLLKCIAESHSSQGQYAQAYGELLEVLALYRSIGYSKLHYTYDMLSGVTSHMGNYQEAIRYSIACVERAQATGDTHDLALFYGRLAKNNVDVNNLEEGIRYYFKVLTYYQQANEVQMIIAIGKNITISLLKQGKALPALLFFQGIVRQHPPIDTNSLNDVAIGLAECYVALKQYSKAEKYYQQMLRTQRVNPQNDHFKIATYHRVGKLYLLRNQYDKARRYLDTALYLNNQVGTLKYAIDLHLLYFRLDSAQGNYVSSIKHYQHYKALNDSIFNETKSRQTASLLIRFQLKEKEQNIALLTKQTQVQQARIQQQELQRDSFIVGTLLLLLLLGVSLNRYRLKQRTNQLLEAKQQLINQQNERLQQVLSEKDDLLEEKENLLIYKDDILVEKDGLLKEKQWLLKEVHHRVKNNLQVVMSLLNSQAAYMLDDKALLAIQESQNRIYAISLIHQKLYLSDNIALIEMDTYIQEVAQYLLESFQMDDRVRLRFLVEPVNLDGVVAVPLGLIINEAVTNSLKYAFPAGKTGVITISLHEVDDRHCRLTIADDGVGLGSNKEVAHSSSLGMELMQGLTRQLDGQLTLENTGGVTVSELFTSKGLIPSQVKSNGLKEEIQA